MALYRTIFCEQCHPRERRGPRRAGRTPRCANSPVDCSGRNQHISKVAAAAVLLCWRGLFRVADFSFLTGLWSVQKLVCVGSRL